MINIQDVKIVEVGPRDGLQNEKNFIPTDAKLALIKSLSAAGLKHIEATSFVNPDKIPQLKDAQELFSKIEPSSSTHYPVLVPNLQGLEAAIDAGAKDVSVFTSASETFNQKNINCSVAESVERIDEIFKVAQQNNLPVRAYLSCCLGCPYEGEIDYQSTAQLAQSLLDKGADEISFGDTIGVGTPKNAEALLETVLKSVPTDKVAMHFHNTYGQALANIYQSLQMGIHIFDSSVAGLGGCPYAQGATGNVATEDVVYLLHGLNIHTGIDLEKLCEVGQDFCSQFNLTNQSRVGVAYTRRS